MFKDSLVSQEAESDLALEQLNKQLESLTTQVAESAQLQAQLLGDQAQLLGDLEQLKEQLEAEHESKAEVLIFDRMFNGRMFDWMFDGTIG